MTDTLFVRVENYERFRVSSSDMPAAYRALAFHYQLNDSTPCWQEIQRFQFQGEKR